MSLLTAEGVVKRYSGVTALSGVDFNADAGEVHALLGENGAGKSTLMKVIAGSVIPDEGRLTLEGRELLLTSPEAARDAGVGIVYQELSLVPSLSVGENVMLGRWPLGRGLVDWRSLHARARRSLDRIGFDISTHRRVAGLGMAEAQLVETAKALCSTDIKVLLLDEPTSALSEPEVQRLFSVIDDLRSEGVAIVYVSHRLKEIMRIADRITVLRDGKRIDTVAAESINETELASMMVGREFVADRPAGRGDVSEPQRVVLRATGIGRAPRLKPVDLELRRGEIVAVFGLVGAGRTELARTLFGLEPATEGSLEIDGARVEIRSPVDAIEHGFGYLGEDRSVGLVPRMTVAENITLAILPRLGRITIDRAKERELAEEYAEELGIRVGSVDTRVETLSGGNQQKVVLARWLCSKARILVLDDATRGIDVGAKEEVFRLVRRLAADGVAVLYLTSEIKEARTLADRLLVMSNGSVVSEMNPSASEEDIMAAAGGVDG